jgi:eukaryotic-like serine/threonine-protein kinase
MRRFFGILLRAMVLLVVGMASALTSMRFAIHGREVQVPKLIGLAPADAERAANAAGLVMFRENRFYSADIPEGRVVSQLPAPGEKVRSGWRVRVAESLGPQRIVIPSVLGQSPRAAEINVRRRGLELNGIASVILPGAPPEQVIAQSPSPNAQGVSSPKVGLLLSAAPDKASFVMPDLSGMRLGEASVAITDAGLQLANVTTAKESGTDSFAQAVAAREPVVTRQSIPAGQKIFSGTSVSVEVLR